MATTTVCHFDINGTIMLFDGTDDIKSSEAVSEIMTKNIYGNVADANQFFLTGRDRISGTTSYYNYLKKHHPLNYKELARKLLETYPQFQDMHESLVAIYESGLNPSFIKFVTHMQSNPSIKIVFRTFGVDRDFVIDQLQKLFPDAGYQFIKLYTKWIGSECRFIMENGSDINLNELISSLPPHVHVFVKDDYLPWLQTGRSVEFGKVIHSMDGFVQYGFDDNPCMSAIGENPSSVSVHWIDSIDAGLDENYFLNKVKC